MGKREIDCWTNEEKKEWLKDHFFYEFDMLNFSVDCLVACYQEDPKKSDILRLRKNIALDSFVIHARNLVEFLYWPPRHDQKGDCVRASDFASTHSWNQLEEQDRPDWVNEIWNRGSQYVLHLCSSRAKPVDRKGWDWHKRQKDLAEVILNFLNDMQSNYKSKELEKVENQSRKIVRSYEDREVTSTASHSQIFHNWSS